MVQRDALHLQLISQASCVQNYIFLAASFLATKLAR